MSSSNQHRTEYPEYIFDAQVMFKDPKLRDDAPIPDLFDFPIILQQFMLGARGSGVRVCAVCSFYFFLCLRLFICLFRLFVLLLLSFVTFGC